MRVPSTQGWPSLIITRPQSCGLADAPVETAAYRRAARRVLIFDFFFCTDSRLAGAKSFEGIPRKLSPCPCSALSSQVRTVSVHASPHCVFGPAGVRTPREGPCRGEPEHLPPTPTTRAAPSQRVPATKHLTPTPPTHHRAHQLTGQGPCRRCRPPLQPPLPPPPPPPRPPPPLTLPPWPAPLQWRQPTGTAPG